MIILATMLSGISLLMSILFLIKPRVSLLFVLFLPLTAGALSAYIAIIGAAGAILGWVYGAPWAVLEERDLGWWIPTGLEPLKAALQEALEVGPRGLREMGLRAATYAATQFSWDGIARSLETAILWAQGDGARPECVWDRGERR